MSAQQKGKQSIGAILKKALTSGSQPSKEELFTVLFYARQILGLICGVVAGSLGLTGIVVLIGFAALNAAISYFYSYSYLQVDSDKVESSELLMEGLVISVMNFLVSWISTYTFVFLKANSPSVSAIPQDL